MKTLVLTTLLFMGTLSMTLNKQNDFMASNVKSLANCTSGEMLTNFVFGFEKDQTLMKSRCALYLP